MRGIRDLQPKPSHSWFTASWVRQALEIKTRIYPHSCTPADPEKKAADLQSGLAAQVWAGRHSLCCLGLSPHQR